MKEKNNIPSPRQKKNERGNTVIPGPAGPE